MFNNQLVQIIVTLHKGDQEALTHLIGEVVKLNKAMTMSASVEDENPVLVLGLNTLNGLSVLADQGIIAGINLDRNALFLLGDVVSTVDKVAIYEDGFPIDKFFIAPRNARSFIALANLYQQDEEEHTPAPPNHQVDRNKVPGFLDLTKTRKIARSVDSIFGDSSKRAFDKQCVRNADPRDSIHHPEGVTLEVRDNQLHLRIDGQVVRRTKVEDAGNNTWINYFDSELIRGVRNSELVNATMDFPNVSLISHAAETVSFSVVVEPVVEELTTSIYDVEMDLNKLSYKIKDERVLVTNVKVESNESGPYKASITSRILNLGGKTREHINHAEYQYTGSGIGITFSKKKDLNEWVAAVEAKRNPQPVEEPWITILVDDEVLEPMLYIEKVGKIVPVTTVDGDYINYVFEDEGLKEVTKAALSKAVDETPLSYYLISHDRDSGVLTLGLNKDHKPVNFNVVDGKLCLDGEEVGVVSKWDNGFNLAIPKNLEKMDELAVRYGLILTLGITKQKAVETMVINANEFSLTLGKGRTNNAAKKLLGSMITTVEESVPEQEVPKEV